jgi:hypothetical protein
MPHPERAADKHLNNEDGLRIFESILAHCSWEYSYSDQAVANTL